MLKTTFEYIFLFLVLFNQLWIATILIYVLLLKNCLDIFLWTGLKLRKLIYWILQTLCFNNSLVWASFLNGIQKNFSEPIFLKRPYYEQQNNEKSVILIGSPMCQTQRNYLPSSKQGNIRHYVCQNCKNNNEILLCNITSHDSCLSKCKTFKHSVETQTISEPEILNAEFSSIQTPTRSSTASDFGKSELDSAESLNNVLKSSNIDEKISFRAVISPVKCHCKNDSSFRCLNSELEEVESPSKNPNSRTTPHNIPNEGFVDVSLEPSPNVSQLLESPLCQINLNSMRNLRLQFSQDICVPKMTPEEKSIFRKSWNKLKLMRKTNKRNYEMRNLKEGNGETAIISQQPSASMGSTNISHKKQKKNLTSEDGDSNIAGCCCFMINRLKSKFEQKVDDSSIVYKKF